MIFAMVAIASLAAYVSSMVVPIVVRVVVPPLLATRVKQIQSSLH